MRIDITSRMIVIFICLKKKNIFNDLIGNQIYFYSGIKDKAILWIIYYSDRPAGHKASIRSEVPNYWGPFYYIVSLPLSF